MLKKYGKALLNSLRALTPLHLHSEQMDRQARESKMRQASSFVLEVLASSPSPGLGVPFRASTAFSFNWILLPNPIHGRWATEKAKPFQRAEVSEDKDGGDSGGGALPQAELFLGRMGKLPTDQVKWHSHGLREPSAPRLAIFMPLWPPRLAPSAKRQ